MSVILTAGTCLYYIGLNRLSLAQTNIVFGSLPLFVTLFSFIMLKQKLHALDIVSFILGVAALIFIFNPHFLNTNSQATPAGPLYVLGGTLLLSFGFVYLKQIGQRLPYTLGLFFYVFLTTIVAPCFMYPHMASNPVQDSYDWQRLLYLLINGVLGFFFLIAIGNAI